MLQVPHFTIQILGILCTATVQPPKLYRDKHSPVLTQVEQKIFYEQGLRPTIQEILGNLSTKWPTTYNNKMFCTHGHNGQLSFQTKVIPQWDVYYLGDTIHHYLELNGSSWATELIFLHEIHGVRHSSFHSFDTKSASKALESFLQANDLHHVVFESGMWWIDVNHMY